MSALKLIKDAHETEKDADTGPDGDFPHRLRCQCCRTRSSDY